MREIYRFSNQCDMLKLTPWKSGKWKERKRVNRLEIRKVKYHSIYNRMSDPMFLTLRAVQEIDFKNSVRLGGETHFTFLHSGDITRRTWYKGDDQNTIRNYKRRKKQINDHLKAAIKPENARPWALVKRDNW